MTGLRPKICLSYGNTLWFIYFGIILLHNLTILPLPNVFLLDCAADVEDKEGDKAAKNDEQGASRGLENVVSLCENIALLHNSLFDFYQ